MRELVAAITQVWHAASAAETEAVGAKLATSFPRELHAFLVVYLTGDLGAGKTTLARGFLNAAGVAGAIRSPTYTLLESYDTSVGTVVHLDLYRLRDPAELDQLGLRDLALPDHLWLIEWAEKGEGWLPSPDVHIHLEVRNGTHRIEARAHSAHGTTWLQRLNA